MFNRNKENASLKKLLIITLLIPFLSCGCGTNFKEIVSFGDLYIQELEKGNYSDMYDMLGSKIRSETTYEDFERYHENLINSGGDIEGFKGPEVKVNLLSARPILYIYKIKFERTEGAYILGMSQKKGKTIITFIDFISLQRAMEITEEAIDSLPDNGVIGVVKRKTKSMIQENPGKIK